MTSGPHQTSGLLPQMQKQHSALMWRSECTFSSGGSTAAAAAAGPAVNMADAQLYCPVMRALFYVKTASFGGGG